MQRGRAVEPTEPEKPDGHAVPRQDGPAAALFDRLDGPMLVATTVAGGARSGCLVGFATQCSIDPCRFLVCISVENHTHSIVARARHLAVHLLGSDQRDLAALFGERTGDEVDKFSKCTWHASDRGVPILAECAAWAEGTVVERRPLGDHTGVVMTPLDGGPGTREGLFTMSRARGFSPGHPA